jgi:hypothetical protein
MANLGCSSERNARVFVDLKNDSIVAARKCHNFITHQIPDEKPPGYRALARVIMTNFWPSHASFERS